MTLREAIDQFRSNTDFTGRVSDDSPWSYRMIKKYLDTARASLLYEKVKRRDKEYNQQTIQVIPCIKFKEAPALECPCDPADGCMFLMSEYPVPSIIHPISFVAGDKIKTVYTYVRWDRFKDKIFSRFKGTRDRGYFTTRKIKNKDYIIIYNDEFVDHGALSAIFNDYLTPQVIKDCTGEIDHCVRWIDMDFVADPDLQRMIYEFALSDILNTRKGASVDTKNNDQADV